MTNFFTSQSTYNERIATCKGCVYYFKPTGQCKRCLCFMKIKARIAPMECPEKYWLKTLDIETPDDLPQEIIDEIIKLWPDLKTGRAKDVTAKHRMIATNYRPGTNCGSCISTSYDGIKKLYKKYSE